MGSAFIVNQRIISLKFISLVFALAKSELKLQDFLSLAILKKQAKKYCHYGYLTAQQFYTSSKIFSLINDIDILEHCTDNSTFLKNASLNFLEFCKNLSPTVINCLIRPLCRKQLFQEPEEMTFF